MTTRGAAGLTPAERGLPGYVFESGSRGPGLTDGAAPAFAWAIS